MPTVTSKDGAHIAYDRSGEGPAVILVEGAMGSRAFGFGGPMTPLLAPHFTVYTYDRRGRGESGDTAPYAVAREVEDIEALINQAGGSASVFGISSGAVLALEAARQLPTKIVKLALYEPPFIVDNGHPPLPDEYVAHLNELVAAGRRGDAVEYFMTAAIGLPAEAVAPMRDMPMWPGMEAVAHTIAYDGAIMGDTMSGSSAPLQRFASVAVPTLVLDGGASPAYMHNGAHAIAEVLPNARYRTLDGQTHEVAVEVLAPVLDTFILG